MGSTDERLGELATEARNPRSERLDELPTLDMLALIQEQDATVAVAVKAVLPQIAAAVDAVSARFAHGGRLLYIGAGTSGRLGVLDASECPPSFGVAQDRFVAIIAGGDSALRRSSEASEDSEQDGARDLLELRPRGEDSVIGIAASGRTPYVLGALKAAGEAGTLTIALTCAPGSRMASVAQAAIEVATGAEVLTGSTRMKAGTATKMVLNMISTGVMVRRGAVFGNLMVNVESTNAKLSDRAVRIVAAACACDADTAATFLRETGSVKLAILMQQKRLTRTAAETLLQQSQGNLRDALRTP